MDRPRTITKSKIIEIIIITLVVIGLTYVSVIAEPSQEERDIKTTSQVEGKQQTQNNSYLEVQSYK